MVTIKNLVIVLAVLGAGIFLIVSAVSYHNGPDAKTCQNIEQMNKQLGLTGKPAGC